MMASEVEVNDVRFPAAFAGPCTAFEVVSQLAQTAEVCKTTEHIVVGLLSSMPVLTGSVTTQSRVQSG
jgi:hypothetical protein